MTANPKTRSIRLYVDQDIASHGEVALDKDQSHYLAAVMRVQPGERLHVFNSRDGERLAAVASAAKRAVSLTILNQTRPASPPPDVELLFAPIKKARTDFIVEKATELGARRIRPVITQRTNAERVRIDRLQAHVIEAAEQCGLVYAPTVLEPVPLRDALSDWPEERKLYFCDEAGGAPPLLAAAEAGPAAILIGPEGGFDPAEAAFIRDQAFATAVTLGPRILRADSAVCAALSIWQAKAGDWNIVTGS